MNWVSYALVAIGVVGFSDLFRKLGSNLKDPFFTNLMFQIGSIVTTVLFYFVFSRKVEHNTRDIMFAVAGGALVSIFSLFSFKALALGPGASTVIPVLRIGGVALAVLLGVLLLREKLVPQSLLGLIISFFGIYLIFSAK